MSRIALEHGATIDKYVGDAIMAFFGDPETKGIKEDAAACVKMAIAMQRRMRELQWEWRDSGLEKPFQLRIGINTGYCTVGNFGSDDRMDYTIISSEVNLAARLQSHAELAAFCSAMRLIRWLRTHSGRGTQSNSRKGNRQISAQLRGCQPDYRDSRAEPGKSKRASRLASPRRPAKVE